MFCRPRAWRYRDQICYLNSIRYGLLKSFGMNKTTVCDIIFIDLKSIILEGTIFM